MWLLEPDHISIHNVWWLREAAQIRHLPLCQKVSLCDTPMSQSRLKHSAEDWKHAKTTNWRLFCGFIELSIIISIGL